MMTDPLSDMLTRIRNAGLARGRTVLMPRSKLKFAVAKLLEAEGFVGSVESFDDAGRPMLRIGLIYDETGKEPRISSLKRVSTPGQRVYRKSKDLQSVRSGTGLLILSTPNGLMTNREARKRHLGGEVICEVY